MGLEPVTGPEPQDRRVADTLGLRHGPRAPVRRPLGMGLRGGRQNLRNLRVGDHAIAPAALGIVKERLGPTGLKPALPQRDRGADHAGLPLNLAEGAPGACHKDNPRFHHQPLRGCLRPYPPSQDLPLFFGQDARPVSLHHARLPQGEPTTSRTNSRALHETRHQQHLSEGR
jgi:hypothetical protein